MPEIHDDFAACEAEDTQERERTDYEWFDDTVAAMYPTHPLPDQHAAPTLVDQLVASVLLADHKARHGAEWLPKALEIIDMHGPKETSDE